MIEQKRIHSPVGLKRRKEGKPQSLEYDLTSTHVDPVKGKTRRAL